MCRLALFNKKGTHYIEEFYGLEKYLDVLEKSCGGNGNGLGLITNGKVTFLNKGLKYSNKEIAKKMLITNYDYAIYHTRVKSAGNIKDSNCHPYMNKEGDFLLAMNGTISELSKFSKFTDLTDTEILFRMLDQNKEFNLKFLKDISCRFIGVKDGRVFASNGGYDRLHFIQKDDILVIASEFPKEFKGTEKTLKNELWLQGDKLDEYTYTTYSNNYDSYYDRQISWGNVNTKKTTERWIKEITPKIFKDTVDKINKQYPFTGVETKYRLAKSILGDIFTYDDNLSEINIVEDEVTGEEIFVIQSIEEDDFGGVLDAI